MLNFVEEMEQLLDFMPIAIAMQEFVENKIVINNAARKLLNVQDFDLAAFRRDISSMRPGVHPLTFGKRSLSVRCALISFRERMGKICILTDVSEQVSVREREQIYKACLDSITDMNLFACDAEGTIILYNNASAKSDNIKSEDVFGRNMYEVFGPESDTAIRRALSTGEPVLDWESAYDAAGKPVRNVGSAYPIKSNGKVIGAFSINRSYEGVRALLMRSIDLQKQLISASDSKKNGTTYDFDSIVGRSEPQRHAVELARRAANSPAPVLIYGETGTGKELFAQSIHNASVRRAKPFVAINCAAIPETLLESTLFGTVRGAFTGADNMTGLLEQADEGTLFLDEINSLPPNLQSKLLRVLQERVFRRVGGKGDLPVQCRIVSSCNCSPLECVANGTIRKDLYYRLAVVCIEVPPLRERREDITLLVDHFLDMYSHIYGVHQIGVSPQLLELLQNYAWPGNVRELRHIIESALVLLNSGETLNVRHLPDIFARELCRGRPQEPAPCPVPARPCGAEPYDLEAKLQEYRRQAIVSALEACGGNVSKAARQIGYNRTTLQYQMEKLGIKI